MGLVAEVTRDRRGPSFMFRGVVGFEWTRVRAPVPGLARELEGFRFIHLSDLHLRSYWSRGYNDLIDAVERSAADLLLITGDFIDNKHDFRGGLRQLERLLPRLKSRLGMYGILGNHDVDLVQPYIRSMGVNLINGGRVVLGSGGSKLELIGFPGVARQDLDPQFVSRQPPREPGTLRIVMSHYPDQFHRAKPLAADFFLAGHTHGGQICLPGGIPIITHDRMPRRYASGIHRLGETWYIVSRGMGYASLPLRVNCPSEVAEVTVAAAR